MVAGDYHGPHDEVSWATWAKGHLNQRDRHVVAVMTGEPGNGKSNLALILGAMIQGTSLDLERQVVWRVGDGIKLAKAMPKGKVMVYDEAIRGANRRRAMSASNNDLLEDLETCRARNQAQIFIYPHVELAESAIMLNAQWVIDCPSKGRAVWKEVLRGGEKKQSTYLQYRFEVTGIPSLAQTRPEYWQKYKATKADRLNNGDGQVDELLELEACLAILDRHGLRSPA